MLLYLGLFMAKVSRIVQFIIMIFSICEKKLDIDLFQNMMLKIFTKDQIEGLRICF